jgi:ABC-2 type transport system permease protein|tara:strand:- start:269 stop:1081 length:813 start_codon:yes stop_codon:yes gene_type:complete
MIEIEKKYKIYEKRFGYINWIGFWTLYKKEVLRFLKVVIQTILSPLVTSLLFLLVLSLAIGNERGEVLGFPFINFLAPGLIVMQVIQQAFSHSSSSIMISKIQGNIVDILYAPLTASEITLAINLAACTRSLMIALCSIIVFSFLIDLDYYNFLYIFIFTFLGAFLLSSIGIIIGLWAEKFDHMASATNFIIVPLSFLSGTFYSIDRLPDVLKNVSEINPFFYIIDGFRYGFLGVADGSIQFGLLYLILLNFIIWFVAYILFKKGYKIKS